MTAFLIATATPGLVGPPATFAGDAAFPGFDGAGDWFNSMPLAKKELRGKVVLVNFWTYSCINSLRELPYMKAWAAKYKDAGLVVVGVHTPEFSFEKEKGNVDRAIRDLKVSYPVAMDNDYRIWRAFNNNYWPANYVVDGKGKIRFHYFGEGAYAQMERIIRELLIENGATPTNGSAAIGPFSEFEAPPGEDVQSPETYVGARRTERFASRPGIVEDERRTYSLPPALAFNGWGLNGAWTVASERAVLQAQPGKIVFRFHSRDLHMVLGPSKDGRPVRFRVTLDGVAPGLDSGADTAADGSGTVQEPRMYQLIRQKGRLQHRTFSIEFLDAGVQAFSFTFG